MPVRLKGSLRSMTDDMPNGHPKNSWYWISSWVSGTWIFSSPPPCAEHRVVTAADVGLRVSFEEGELFGEAFRRAEVVRIHEGDEFSAGGVQRPIAGACGSRIEFVVHQYDAVVLCGVGACDLGRSVGRCVVDDDQFEVADRLPEDVLDAFADESLCVVEWHDDAYEGGLLFHRCLLFG